jgi:hypothetical protein
MHLTFLDPIPGHIMMGLYEWFHYEPADTQTCREMQRYLDQRFPGPTWLVALNGPDILVQMEFADPRDQTLWLLRWT